MGFAINLSILDDLVKADRPMLNRCSKENPYSFRKKRYCCSRPVDFQWQKDGYCYGKTQRCSHEEGCENCKFFCFFFNRHYSLLNFGPPQLYNSEALQFTYNQYVIIELADKLYNSVAVCFCVSPWIFIKINKFFKLLVLGIEPLHHKGVTLSTYKAVFNGTFLVANTSTHYWYQYRLCLHVKKNSEVKKNLVPM